MSEKVKREDKSAGEEPEPFAKRVKKEDSEDEAPLKTKSKKQTIQVSTCVLVTGTEYKDIALRDKLKSLGATWHKSLVGWVLPESLKNYSNSSTAHQLSTIRLVHIGLL